jgi:Cu+-exporting ATPase
LALAITAHAEKQDIDLLKVADPTNTPGKGLSAQINDRMIFIGSAAYLQENGIITSTTQLSPPDDLPASTMVWIGEGNVEGGTDSPELTEKLLGIIYLSDQIREDAYDAVNNLKSTNIKPVLLSGDNQAVVSDVAQRLGIDTFMANVLPQNKADEITALQKQGYIVAMVGDGINDAPALATADIGIAMGNGSDIAIDTASITLIKSSPQRVLDSIGISKATYSKIHQNLFWAFIYNLIVLPMAAGGMLNPVIAGAAMALSSVSVVSSSLLLKRWKPSKPPQIKPSKGGTL